MCNARISQPHDKPHSGGVDLAELHGARLQELLEHHPVLAHLPRGHTDAWGAKDDRLSVSALSLTVGKDTSNKLSKQLPQDCDDLQSIPIQRLQGFHPSVF